MTIISFSPRKQIYIYIYNVYIMIDDEWSWYHAAWCTLSTIHHSQVSGGDKIEPYMFSRPIALKLNAQEGADPASGRDAPVDPWAILVDDECWWHKMMIVDVFSRWWMCSSFWVSDMLSCFSCQHPDFMWLKLEMIFMAQKAGRGVS